MSNIIDAKIETEQQILFLKNIFQEKLAKELNLLRVTAPLVVKANTGINDNLNGVERPIKFNIKDDDIECEIVQSLAKWKRLKVTDYCLQPGSGLYTDMNALRIDETLDDIHSIYVDQWDYEIAMRNEDRNVEFLKTTVRKIYNVIYNVACEVEHEYHIINTLPSSIYFIHSEELYDIYPHLTSKQREDEICKLHGAVFIIGIGGEIRNTGTVHDSRSPDYDDFIFYDPKTGFRGLNGDILVWNTILNRAFELSSMGIRVDPSSLREQLELTHTDDRKELFYHKKLLNGELIQTLGGGVGTSRLAMFFLHKKHIGEVQSSIWTTEIIEDCKKRGINLL
jgi:aspartate--ammonia ligase